MTIDYTPDPGNAVTLYTLPEDGELASAASVNTPLAQLADGVAKDSAAIGVLEGQVIGLDGRVVVLEDYVAPALPNFARRDDFNTFEQTQTFENNDVTRAPIEIPESAEVAEKWRLVLSFKSAGGQYIYHYTGCVEALGSYAIVTNCQWIHANNQWERRSADFPSHAVIWKYGRLHVASREAALAAWTDWDASPGSVELFVAGLIEAGALRAGGNVESGGYFNYLTQQVRTTSIDIMKASPGLPSTLTTPTDRLDWYRGAGTSGWIARIAGAIFEVPVVLPPGARLQRIDVWHSQSALALNSMKLAYRDAMHWEDPTLGSSYTEWPGDAPVPGSGLYVTSIHTVDIVTGPLTIDPSAEYHVSFTAGDEGIVLARMRAQWLDLGPR